jgi:FimV-like protein
MNAARSMGAVLLAGAALGTIPWSPALGQAASSHEVRRGEGLLSISDRFRPAGATRFQVVIALYRANQDQFPDGNINVLSVGQVLRVPSRDDVFAVTPGEASRQWQSLIAAKPVQTPVAVAAAKPAPLMKTPVTPSAAAPLTAEAAAKRYRDGLGMERRGDEQGALAAFLEAGEAGNGLAQLRLGQIYDKGNAVVQRDYQTALKWYQKAREQGVDIDKPLQRTTPR